MADKSDNAQREPGKPKEVYISQDMLKAIRLLEHLYGGNTLKCDALTRFFDNATPEKAKRIVEALTKGSLPVRLAEGYLYWADLFDEQAVGRRKYQYWASKESLAKKVVELLIKQTPVVRSIFLGAGTSALYVTHELIRRIDDLKSLYCVYTNNFLAMDELVRRRPQLPIHVPEGEIRLQGGAIISDEGIGRMNGKSFDAVVTGFYGLSFENGFSSDHQYDRQEKLMNLRPTNCSKIYIVLNWEKIGTKYEVVATVQEAINKDKQYFIVTDPPKGWETNPDHADKLEEIKKWSDLVEQKIVHFEYVERRVSP
jgi:DeoR/GlpR family transcriptional regulator of sugar metabolism